MLSSSSRFVSVDCGLFLFTVVVFSSSVPFWSPFCPFVVSFVSVLSWSVHFWCGPRSLLAASGLLLVVAVLSPVGSLSRCCVCFACERGGEVGGFVCVLRQFWVWSCCV